MKVSDIDAVTIREITPGASVAPRFPGRWSPRAMDGTALTRDERAEIFSEGGFREMRP